MMKNNTRRYRIMVAIIPLTMIINLHCCSTETNGPNLGKVVASQTEPNWRELFPNHAPEPRAEAYCCYDSVRQRMIVFGGRYYKGGFGNDIYYNDTWEFDGTDWKQMEVEIRPSARYWGEMCYCPSWDSCILFGGLYETERYTDTWRYRNGEWTKLNPQHKPSPRWDFAMVFDENVGKILLFGGCSETKYLCDFWTFDGTDWQLVFDFQQGIDCRCGAKMVYDSFRKKTVLYGGYYGMTIMGNTWEYDGQQWKRIETTHPVIPGRTDFRLSYDKFQRKTVLFGGGNWSIPATYGDTWEYDGTTWKKIQTAVSHPSRKAGHFVYMDNLFGSIYFGGCYYASQSFNDTWLYSAATQYSSTPMNGKK